jgi:hypothetical protein
MLARNKSHREYSNAAAVFRPVNYKHWTRAEPLKKWIQKAMPSTKD